MSTDAPWHSLAPREAAARLAVDPALGLPPAEVAARRAEHGPNSLPQVPPPSLWSLLWRQLRSPIVLILVVTAAVSLLMREVADALAILVALLLNVAVGFFMDFRAEHEIAALQALTPPRARVRRGGVEVALPAAELLPGDVILLEAGDRVPADARLVSGALAVDESLLTGESAAVDKLPAALPTAALALSARANEVFSGTLVQTGAGVALVTGTGAATEIGRIGALLSRSKPPPLPLDLRLEALGRYIIITVTALCAVLVSAGLWQGQPFWPLLRMAVVLAVAAIPEGLPSVATLALAAGSRRLARAKLRLRYLGVLEALGGVSTLCLDKTGTLTANQMTARAVRTAARELTISGEGFAPTGQFLLEGQAIDAAADPLLLELLDAGRRCNLAALEQHAEGWRVLGDPSEGALLSAAAKAGLGTGAAVQEVLHSALAGAEHPWMVLVTRSEGQVRAYVKGAPEHVIARCAAVRTAAGAAPLDEAGRAEWLQANQRLAARALRVFAVAVSPAGADAPDAEQGFVLLGLIGLADPPRAGVKEALQQAHQAGIRTIMITGDQPATALAIARELDLANGREPKVESGVDTLAADVDVYARATPEGKYLLVRRLQEGGLTVAMTGDGVNDAPALRAADVGVAMGHGTEVAKGAAAVILIEEKLATLLLAVREGRAVFLNIQRALDYLLSCSTATVLTALLATLVGFPPLLLPLQILYLNLLMHTFPALGLTLEPAEARVMQRPPVPRSTALLPPLRLASVIWHGLIISLVTVAIGGWGLRHGGIEHARSLTFATLATALLLHVFCDRSPRMFRGWWAWRNRTLLVFVMVALGLQLLALYLPPLRRLLSLTSFDAHDWLGILGSAAASVFAIELSKRIFRAADE